MEKIDVDRTPQIFCPKVHQPEKPRKKFLAFKERKAKKRNKFPLSFFLL
jgi:hypothetical protein